MMMRQHVLVVRRVSQQAQLTALEARALERFEVAVRNVCAAVSSSSPSWRPCRARRLIRLTLPCVCTVLQQPHVLERRFTPLSALLLRELLFLYAHAHDHAHDDALVAAVVARVAARMRAPHLRALTASLLHIAAASRGTPFLWSSSFRAYARHHRFVQVLQPLLEHGLHSPVARNLRPETCTHLIATVSAACAVQCANNAHQRAALVHALLHLFESHIAHHTADDTDNSQCASLFLLAVCAALLRFIALSAHGTDRDLHRPSRTLRNLLLQFVHQALQRFEQQMRLLAVEQITETVFHAAHSRPISLLFIISSISSIAVKHLSSAHMQLTQRAIETCVQTSVPKQRPESAAAATAATVHHQLCGAIANNCSTLATAYAHFIQQQRRFQTCVHFLTTLLSTAPSSQTACRFAHTVIANTTVSPDIAVSYVSILSFITARHSVPQPAVTHRLSSLIARDQHATIALVQLICVILRHATGTDDTNRRLLFLFRFLSLVLTTQSTEPSSTNRSAHVLDEDEQTLWLMFANQVLSLWHSDSTSQPMLSASTQCVSELVRRQHESTKLATHYLSEALTRVMIEKYLFRDTPITITRRLVHVVPFLDAITSATKDAHMFEAFLSTLVDSAEKVGAHAHRMLGILLLRCLTRCDEKVVSVALDKMTSFIGTNRDRKETFLPLVRAAVLGLDTAKKHVCVVWMMRLFADMKPLQRQSRRATAVIATNTRTAKL